VPQTPKQEEKEEERQQQEPVQDFPLTSAAQDDARDEGLGGN